MRELSLVFNLVIRPIHDLFFVLNTFRVKFSGLTSTAMLVNNIIFPNVKDLFVLFVLASESLTRNINDKFMLTRSKPLKAVHQKNLNCCSSGFQPKFIA